MKSSGKQGKRRQGLKNMDTAADGLKPLLEQKNKLMETFENSKRSYGEIMDFLKTERG